MTDYLTDAQADIKTYFKTHDIPTYFYQCLFGEIVKMLGASFLIPDENYDAGYDDDGDIIATYEGEYSYKDQLGFSLAYITGTGGWGLAFKEACQQCDLMDLYDDYSHMEWVRSDIFDGYIADKMLEVIFDDAHRCDYYKFKMQKEKTK